MASENTSTVYDFELDGGVLGFAPMIRTIVSEIGEGRESGEIAAAFHNTLAAASAEVCESLRAAHSVDTVVLSGGVFMNTLLKALLTNRLTESGFKVYTHRVLSCGDSSVSLGQAAVALARHQHCELEDGEQEG